MWVLLFLVGLARGSGVVRLDGPWLLEGDAFRLPNASVPGDVYAALFEGGQIPDPYAGSGDVDLRGIAEKDWVYSRTFALDDPGRYALLRFDGLDTVAEVRLNKAVVGSAENMFRRYLFNVSGHILRGENSISVHFTSPIRYAKEASEAYLKKYDYSVPPDCPAPIQNPACHSNFIRKMQSSFSWDWGPAFPTMGIWRSVQLHTFNSTFLHRITAVPTFSNTKLRISTWPNISIEGDGMWKLHVQLKIWSASKQKLKSCFRLRQVTEWKEPLKLRAGWNDARIQLAIQNTSAVELWWPRGYGPQTLFSFFALLYPEGEAVLSSAELRIGFRTLRLAEEHIEPGNEAFGRNFFLEVNGVGVFLKGSNWIPADSFLSRVSRRRLEFYFHSLVETNSNAIRVWGGGVYESDEFYDLADRHGILIWQDMMFAVALYPSDEDFLANVRHEATDAFSRLGHHASVAVWAGNNENELGLRGGWYHSAHMGTMEQYEADYLRLYNATIWGALNASLPAAPFVLSSPSNGVETLAEGGISGSPASPLFGDVHYYNYAGDAWDPQTFPIPRCATEFGYQSLPAYQSLVGDLGAEGLGFWSATLLHRQHHPAGNVEMLNSVLFHFPLPRCRDSSEWLNGPGSFQLQAFNAFTQLCKNPFPSKMKPEAQFLKDMTYLTQIHQAVAYKTEVESYRRWRNRTQPHNGMGNTMCALYWQLNDIWVAPSWSTIDYYGRWKMAHNYATKFFSPVLLSPYREGGNLVVVLINDGRSAIGGASVRLRLFDWATGRTVAFERDFRIDPVPALSARVVYTSNLGALRALRTNQQHDKGQLGSYRRHAPLYYA